MSELIDIPSPGVPIYVGMSEGPLVILIHDYYGRLPGIQRIAEAYAREGFYVAIPDLFNGVATKSALEAEKLMSGLDVGIALAELDDVVQSRTNDQKVGTVGFSMGGWLGLLHAQGGSVDASAAYYASLGPDDHGVIPAPVLLNFAENDSWDAAQEPVSFIERLHEHGTPVTDHVYIGTEHSFANSDISSTYNRRAAELANARTVQFMLSHLFIR